MQCSCLNTQPWRRRQEGRGPRQQKDVCIFHGDFGPSALTPREASNLGTSGTCLLPRDRFCGLTPSELFSFFWPCHTACGILVPDWDEPEPAAVEVQSLNHWAAKEAPEFPLEPTVSPSASSCEKLLWSHLLNNPFQSVFCSLFFWCHVPFSCFSAPPVSLCFFSGPFSASFFFFSLLHSPKPTM